MKDPTKNQTSSPTGWLCMHAGRMSLRRTKSTIISWDGSCICNNSVFPLKVAGAALQGALCNHSLSHKIMVLFVLRKQMLQTCMRNQPVELDVWFLVGPFVYFHTSCVWTAKALVRLHQCADLPEPPWSPMFFKYHNLVSWLLSKWMFFILQSPKRTCSLSAI